METSGTSCQEVALLELLWIPGDLLALSGIF